MERWTCGLYTYGLLTRTYGLMDDTPVDVLDMGLWPIGLMVLWIYGLVHYGTVDLLSDGL